MSVTVIGADTAVSGGTELTNPVSTNTKSDWTQISASTAAAANALIVEVIGFSAAGDVLLDIGTGAGGAESVLVENLHFRSDNGLTKAFYFYLPVSIAAGTRVAARYQATATTVDVWFIMHLCNDANNILLTGCTPVTYGAATTDSGGTGVDPGASTNTKGGYAEISAATSADIDWLTVFVGSRNNAAPATTSWLVDIATGAALSESVVIPNIYFHTHASNDVIDYHAIGPFPVTIPSGTRLSARAQCSTNDATDRLIDVLLIGWDGAAASGGGGGFSAFIGR